MGLVSQSAVLAGPGGPIEITTFPVPDPLPPRTFLLRVELAGICGTDAHIYQGHFPPIEYPVILGHEFVGTIAALGEGIACDYLGQPVSVGDRVALKPGLSCGQCYECVVAKNPGRCPFRWPAYGFKSPATTEPHLSGGFAEYLFAYIPGTIFFKTQLPPEIAVLMEPLATSLHAVDRARLQLDSTVVVQGVGAIGLLAVAGARLAGASRIIAIGGPPERLEVARRLGADQTIDIAKVPDRDQRRSLVWDYLGTDRGASAVIGCVGQPAAFLEGLSLVAYGGVMCEAGHFTDTGSIAFNPYSDLLWRNISVEGVLGAGADTTTRFRRSISILERRALPYELIVSHRVGLVELESALQALSGTFRLRGRDAIKITIDPWK